MYWFVWYNKIGDIMNYFIEELNHIVIKGEVIYRTINSYINKLCIDNYSTLKGRILATKKKLNIKYNVPIYVNKKILLFKIKDSDRNYYINYYKINDYDYSRGSIVIVFKDLEVLKISVSKKVFNDRMRLCELIDREIE